MHRLDASDIEFSFSDPRGIAWKTFASFGTAGEKSNGLPSTSDRKRLDEVEREREVEVKRQRLAQCIPNLLDDDELSPPDDEGRAGRYLHGGHCVVCGKQESNSRTHSSPGSQAATDQDASACFYHPEPFQRLYVPDWQNTWTKQESVLGRFPCCGGKWVGARGCRRRQHVFLR